jgi:hypothetical protein
MDMFRGDVDDCQQRGIANNLNPGIGFQARAFFPSGKSVRAFFVSWVANMNTTTETTQAMMDAIADAREPCIVDAKGLGRILGLHPATVLRLGREGHIPRIQLSPVTVRFDLREVLKSKEADQ